MSKSRINEKKLKDISIAVGLLPQSGLAFFFRVLFSVLTPTKRQYVIDTVCNYQFEDRGKWRKIDKYMSGCFSNHYEYKPCKVAHMCVVYFKIPSNMEPLLLKRARKIKDRVRKRRDYYRKLQEEHAAEEID